jgi:HD superfamily phosphohydrolase
MIATTCVQLDRDLDIDKLDYTSRDVNHSHSYCKLQYDRIIVHCRTVGNDLAWRSSERFMFDRLFFKENDMDERVYQK